MLTVIAVLKVQSGKEDEMENALKEVLPKVQTEEGTLGFVILKSQSEPEKFLCYEKYKDKEAFEAHTKTPHFGLLFEKIGPLLAGEPSIEMYEEVACI